MNKKAGNKDEGKNLRRVNALTSRYFIGIDLGTTNSSVAYIDRLREEGPTEIKIFDIPQITSPGVCEELDLLPSFFYFPAGFELPAGATKLPWKDEPDFIVGKFAREQGAIVPGRMVSSVKSWLCNARVDRHKKILPWNRDNNMAGFSPVEISAYYLSHIKDAWNHRVSNNDPDYMFENQEVILTVPASFDEVARELTLKAAKEAGLKSVTLLEEPQAAFYYWIYKNKIDWAEKLNDGDVILICDVGGGTTDFTLITASKNSDNFLELKRIAVGDHILLGGDNMDMAIAHHFEKTHMAGQSRLDALSWTSLCMKCRSLKETLLGEGGKSEDHVSITGRGKSVVASTMKFSLTRDEAAKIMLDGFFNEVDFKTIDNKIKSAAGLRESGLPYADDPSVSNHLARFLRRHIGDVSRNKTLSKSHNIEFVHPDKILFNGGVFKSTAIRNRVMAMVSKWVGEKIVEDGANIKQNELVSLENSDLDLAVSLGAAYYAYAKSGSGIRIKSGSARSYFIGVSEAETRKIAVDTEKKERAVCLVARGMEEGKKSTLENGFQLITNQPVQFTLFSSTVNPGATGEIVEISEGGDYLKLPPLLTCLTYGKKSRSPQIDVSLSAYLSEVGTIDLYCISKISEHRWKLQFNFRKHETEASKNHANAEANTTGERVKASDGYAGTAAKPGAGSTGDKNETAQNSAEISEESIKTAENIIERGFSGKTAQDQAGLLSIMKKLESHFNMKKEQWPTGLLRALYAAILKTAEIRDITAVHEERWLNLAGFLLRPGFGAQMDEWRVKEALRITFNGVMFKSNKSCVVNYYVFLRRIAGGMTAGQQLEIYNKTIKENLLSSKKAGDKPFKVTANNQEQVELLRLAASFELLPEHEKINIGTQLKKAVNRDGVNPISVWALSRLGARSLVYGGTDSVIAPEHVERWIETLMDFDWIKESYIPYSVIMMSRVTGDRKNDLGPEIMARVQKRIEACPASEHLYDLLMNMAAMTEDDQKLFFGESLPHGIVLKK